MSLVDLLASGAFILASVGLFVALRYRHKFSRFISVKRLGLIERDFPDLKQVIVVANKVERPHSTLEEAVEDNFRQHVKYLFLVSNSHAEQELSGYYLIFEALAKIAIRDENQQLNIRDLVDIRRLPYDWPDFPYIIYQYIPPGNETRYTIAYRGNKRGEGIADYYERLHPRHSEAFIRALLAEAPQEIQINLKLVKSIPVSNTTAERAA